MKKPVNAHAYPREKNEHYVEEQWCDARLFEQETFYGDVWDCCCGWGRIAEAARDAGHEVFATDLVDRGYEHLDKVGDFLAFKEGNFPPNIVCNPPFKILRKFVMHALSLPTTRKIAMVCPTTRYHAAHWLDQTPLVRVLAMSPRPSMPPGQFILDGGRVEGGWIDFSWLIFEVGYTGGPVLGRLLRDPPPPVPLAAAELVCA